MAKLPIFAVKIQASRRCIGPHEQKMRGYPESPQTIGQHLKKCRLELRPTQEAVAQIFGVTYNTLCHWATGQTEPEVCMLPAITQFLGFSPLSRFDDFQREDSGIAQAPRARQASASRTARSRCEIGEQLGSRAHQAPRPVQTFISQVHCIKLRQPFSLPL